MSIGLWSPTYGQSVFKRYHSDKHFSEFCRNKITSLSPLRGSSRFSSVSFCWRWGRTNDASPLLSVPSHLRCGHIFISIYSWLSDLPLYCLSMLLVVYLSFLCLWCCSAALWLATCWGGGKYAYFSFTLKQVKSSNTYKIVDCGRSRWRLFAL